MAAKSAGLLVFKRSKDAILIFLVHPGGPLYKKKDEGVWSIPKGEYAEGEEPLVAAMREFEEETGQSIKGKFITLTPIKQRGGKIVTAFAVEAEPDADNINCNTFSMEWPPRSGKFQEFPEIDRASWLSVEEAKKKILPAQQVLVDELLSILK
jgi:predicted NUDIX family NTP pyrophosphohydrolase